MAELFLPVLSHFLNNNPWTASHARMRYRAVPAVNEDLESGTLNVEVWEGPWAYEFSTVEEEKTFPLTSEGLEELGQWLMEWSGQINARPPRSMEENWNRRKNDP